MTEHRYDFEAVRSFLGGHDGTIAEHLGVTRFTVLRWKREGLSRRQADRIAGRLRMHEYELWPETAEHDIEAAAVTCAADDCPVRFIPNGTQRFCSPTCRRRIKMRRYRSTPERAEQNRRHRRAYWRRWESPAARARLRAERQARRDAA